MVVDRSRVFAAVLVVAGAVLPFLIAQPDDIVPVVAKVVLGAFNAGIVALAAFLNIAPAPPK